MGTSCVAHRLRSAVRYSVATWSAWGSVRRPVGVHRRMAARVRGVAVGQGTCRATTASAPPNAATIVPTKPRPSGIASSDIIITSGVSTCSSARRRVSACPVQVVRHTRAPATTSGPPPFDTTSTRVSPLWTRRTGSARGTQRWVGITTVTGGPSGAAAGAPNRAMWGWVLCTSGPSSPACHPSGTGPRHTTGRPTRSAASHRRQVVRSTALMTSGLTARHRARHRPGDGDTTRPSRRARW